MSENDYFTKPGLSKSQLKNWDIYNPSKFWEHCTFNPKRTEVELNDAMAQGQLFHAYLFERDKVVDMFEVRDDLGKMRSNKKWTAAQEKTRKTIITTEENDHAVSMVEALLKHQIIRDILDGGISEIPFFWHDEEWDIDCKMKGDLVKNTTEGMYGIDYKTTGKMAENTRYIDKGGYQYDSGFYSRGIKAKYGKPCVKFIYIFQSSKDGEENDIRIKVVEGPNLEACEIETDRVVKEIVPKIKAWKACGVPEVQEKIWLPEVTAEAFEVSPWFDRQIAENIHKGNN